MDTAARLNHLEQYIAFATADLQRIQALPGWEAADPAVVQQENRVHDLLLRAITERAALG